jgi:hypothetical protein
LRAARPLRERVAAKRRGEGGGGTTVPKKAPARARVGGTRVAARGEREPTEFAAPLCLIAIKLIPFERNVR